jgi:hypothetical protein
MTEKMALEVSSGIKVAAEKQAGQVCLSIK